MIKNIVIFLLTVLANTFYSNSFAQEYELVWSDEFDYTGKPNEASWSFEEGFVRNEEFQWYQQKNAWCENGVLIIEGRKEKTKNPNFKKNSNDWRRNRKAAHYTSSSINTKGKHEFLYGRFEIRAKIPVAGGAWPAIWTLGSAKEWPSNGEIDIMEYYRINGVPHILANTAWGTEQRYVAKWNTQTKPFSYFTDKDPDWASKFHIWRMDWDEEFIRIYVDDELLNETSLNKTINGSLGDFANPFKQPHYLLLNLAIGGKNGGTPDNKAFPMRYEVDYVRVYQKKNIIRSGELWPDNDGVHINAHGGGLLYHNGEYYWFGEYKSENTNSALVGVNCYSSEDLYHWKKEGIALAVEENEQSDIAKGSVIERPKVVYNRKTGKFVMWFHLELKGQGYNAARSGVAVSDNVTGPYTFLRSHRINPGIYPLDMTEQARNQSFNMEDYKEWWTPKWYKAVENGLFVKRDLQDGQMARDMTVFVDDDGKAYHIYSSEENLTLHIAELSEDYLTHTGKYVRLAPAGHNEAPAIFKRNGTYWMITSGCTGWDPNAARLFSSPAIFGPWTQHPNPCRGEGAELTFGGQSTFIQPIHGKKDVYLFMADMWRPKTPIDGRYLWLPIQFDNDVPYLEWIDEWNLDFFDKK